MSHNCRSLLCDTPHYENDDHREECLCEMCHPEHGFEEYLSHPDCEPCIVAAKQWFDEAFEDIPWKLLADLYDKTQAAWKLERQKERARNASY